MKPRPGPHGDFQMLFEENEILRNRVNNLEGNEVRELEAETVLKDEMFFGGDLDGLYEDEYGPEKEKISACGFRPEKEEKSTFGKVLDVARVIVIGGAIMGCFGFVFFVVLNGLGWFDITKMSRGYDGEVHINYSFGFLWDYDMDYRFNPNEVDGEHSLSVSTNSSYGYNYISMNIRNKSVVSVDGRYSFYDDIQCNVEGRRNEICDTAEKVFNRWREEIDLDRLIEEASALPVPRRPSLDESTFFPR